MWGNVYLLQRWIYSVSVKIFGSYLHLEFCKGQGIVRQSLTTYLYCNRRSKTEFCQCRCHQCVVSDKSNWIVNRQTLGFLFVDHQSRFPSLVSKVTVHTVTIRYQGWQKTWQKPRHHLAEMSHYAGPINSSAAVMSLVCASVPSAFPATPSAETQNSLMKKDL